MNKSKDKNRSGVLKDYKKVGQKFIPPLVHKAKIQAIAGYSRQTLPQLVWWAVIAETTSQQCAIDIAGEIGNHFRGGARLPHWWAFTADYTELEEKEFEGLKKHLKDKNLLRYLQLSLEDFLRMFPECPLKGFMDGPIDGDVDRSRLQRFETLMLTLENKRSKEAVLMQAQAVYLGFALNKLQVTPGLALADFPMVSDYPSTKRSMEVGASICAYLNALAGQHLPQYPDDKWSIYFWNRCYKMHPFNLEHLENG